ncbi:MAG: GNAT family N-acetyltransferase [Parvibaculaceae bacterium]
MTVRTDNETRMRVQQIGRTWSRSLFTPRLTLRPVAEADAEGLAAYGSDDLIRQKTETIPFPHDAVAAQAWISEARALRETGDAFRFAIIERASGRFVGVAALSNMSELGSSAELGYWLGRPFWDRGFGREAVAATVAFGRDILRLSSLEALVYSENTASVAVLHGQSFRQTSFELRDVPERGGKRLIRRFERDFGDENSTAVQSLTGSRVA